MMEFLYCEYYYYYYYYEEDKSKAEEEEERMKDSVHKWLLGAMGEEKNLFFGEEDSSGKLGRHY